MSDRTVYDKMKDQRVAFPVEGLTSDDFAQFLKETNLAFVAMGQAPNWDDPTLFTCQTQTYPAAGRWIKWEKVLEWKRANDAIGPRVLNGGVYRSHEGYTVTTIGQGASLDDKSAQIIFQHEDGQLGTCPAKTFFDVISHEGVLVARFAYAAEELQAA